jgi:hypothetical protein
LPEEVWEMMREARRVEVRPVKRRVGRVSSLGGEEEGEEREEAKRERREERRRALRAGWEGAGREERRER